MLKRKLKQSLILILLTTTLLFAAASNAGVSSYADAVSAATPSVVNIYTTKMVEQQPAMQQYGDSPFFRDLFRGMSPRMEQRAQESLGSGVIVNKDGYILTNAHVVRGASSIKVSLFDGRSTQAKIIGIDSGSDLAVLKINLDKLKPVSMGDSNQLRAGDVVLAIGNPFGLNQSVTIGIISATGRQSLGINQFEDFIQTDAAINPGNSGGALITADGKLIGINSAIYSSSGGNNGIGFAVPINLAEDIMQQLIETGKVSRGWLGVQIQSIDLKRARNYGYSYNGGVAIIAVVPDSPASNAGVIQGDIVLKLDGKSVKDSAAFFQRVAAIKPNNSIPVIVLRSGREKELNIKVGERPIMQANYDARTQGSQNYYQHQD
jgi:serine protease DegS